MKKLTFLLFLMLSVTVNAQDVIVKKDGSTILAKVVRVTTDVVKYKDFSNQNSSLKSINARDLLVINYEDGEREFFSKVNEVEGAKSEETEVIKSDTSKPIPSDDELLNIYKGLKKKSGNDAELTECIENENKIVFQENKNKRVFQENENKIVFQENENKIVLSKGFEIPLEINSRISPLKIRGGCKVDFNVSEDVVVDGIMIIPAGSRAVGEVVKTAMIALFPYSNLVIKMNRIEMPNGSILNISDAEVIACSADEFLKSREIVRYCTRKKRDSNIQLFVKLTNDLKIPLK